MSFKRTLSEHLTGVEGFGHIKTPGIGLVPMG